MEQQKTDSQAPAVLDSTMATRQSANSYSSEIMSAAPPDKRFADPTPLDKLGDTPEWIDCPFCHQRTQTRLETKKNSVKKILATGFWVVVCVCWAWTPWAGHWFEETSYFCSGCGNKVASQRQGAAHILYGPDGALPPKPRFIAGQGDGA